MPLLSHIKLAAVVEVPHSHHPVVVEPPQVKRKEFPFVGFIDFQGLKIDVENKKGEYRRGTDKDGHEWKCFMHAHYGEIRDTRGTDGDNLDVYVGPNHDASLVVVIRQHKPDTGAFDEDKVMVGYDSIEQAIGAYKLQYDKPGFYKEGDYLAMPIGRFWRWVHDERKQGKKVANVLPPYTEKVAIMAQIITHVGKELQARAAMKNGAPGAVPAPVEPKMAAADYVAHATDVDKTEGWNPHDPRILFGADGHFDRDAWREYGRLWKVTLPGGKVCLIHPKTSDLAITKCMAAVHKDIKRAQVEWSSQLRGIGERDARALQRAS